jgi:hypothetical protein
MPIFGVTDRGSLEARFKEIGKLRKGGPKTAQGHFGKDLEWFRFTSDRDNVVKAFRQAYGDQPASMEVLFPYQTIEAVFPTFRELYGQNHLLKEQCDGFNIIQWQNGPYMERGSNLCEKPCKNVETRPPCRDCPLKPIGRLSVILLPLLRAGIVGTVTVETHAWNDIAHITNQLAKYEPLTGRTFRIYREENTIGAPNKSTQKRMAVDKWLVKIEPTQETAMLLIQDAQRRARQALLGGPVNAAQLEAGQPDNTNSNPESVTPPPVQEGEFTEAEPPPDLEPEPQQPVATDEKADTNGARPYDAEGTIAKLNKIANSTPNEQRASTDNDMAGWLAVAYTKLQECFGVEGAASMADLVIYAVFKTFSSDLTIAQVNALLSWLLRNKEQDSGGDYILHKHAPAEAKAVYDMAMLTGLEIPPF